MSLDQRVGEALRHVAACTTAPEVDVSALRSTTRTRRLRTGLGAAAVVGLLVAGASLVGGPGPGAPRPVDPGPVRWASESPSPLPTSVPTPLPARGPLEPGTYAMSRPAGSVADYERLVLTVPAGWTSSDGMVHRHRGEPGEVAFSAWTVDRVYTDPCRWRTSSVTPIDLADTSVHEALHTTGPDSILGSRPTGGLANQQGRGPAELVRTTLGGELALRMRLSVPPDLDIADCDEREYRSWAGLGGDGRVANSHHSPAQVDTVYLVDIDRAPLVVVVSQMPSASSADVAELDAVVASMVVDRGP